MKEIIWVGNQQKPDACQNVQKCKKLKKGISIEHQSFFHFPFLLLFPSSSTTTSTYFSFTTLINKKPNVIPQMMPSLMAAVVSANVSNSKAPIAWEANVGSSLEISFIAVSLVVHHLLFAHIRSFIRWSLQYRAS